MNEFQMESDLPGLFGLGGSAAPTGLFRLGGSAPVGLLDRALPMEGRATFLPFRDTLPGSVMNKREFALPGLLAGALNAFTAPGRSLRGSDPTFNPEEEALNVAMTLMGGGGMSAGAGGPGVLGMNTTRRALGLENQSNNELAKVLATNMGRPGKLVSAGILPATTSMNEAGNTMQKIKMIRAFREGHKSLDTQYDPLLVAALQSRMISKSGYAPVVMEVVGHGGSTSQGRMSAFREDNITRTAVRKAEELAKEERNVSRYFDNEISGHWNSAKAKEIETSARLGFDADREAASATMEAVVRNARKLGWTTEHTSKSNSGVSSSRYMVSPDGARRVRISDHELPNTPMREYNRSIGLTGRWDDEIITNGWRHESLANYLKQLVGTE